jgi:hypothetical protein
MPLPIVRRVLAAAAVSLLIAGPLSAAEKTYRVTVSAGEHDRQNAPVRVDLAVPAELAKSNTAALAGELDGHKVSLVGQLTAPGLLSSARPEGDLLPRELHFIPPPLKAGQTLVLEATVGGTATSPSPPFRWSDTPGQFAELSHGDRPVLRYMYLAYDPTGNREATYKVFHHVYDPSGKEIVTKGPGGRYTHHRGIFYGFAKVTYGDDKKVDIWHCSGDTHQSHAGFLAAETGPVLGRHRILIDWCGIGNEVFAKEERELTAYNTAGGTLIAFASRLRPTAGRVQVDGDPQHAGFHFRASNEVAEKTARQTYYVRPDGTGKPGETRNWPGNADHVNLAFNAMSFVVGGERYTCCYLDRPENPKEARFSERDYGRFGSYFVAEATAEKPLDASYRLWLQSGEMTVDGVAAHGRNFTTPPAVKGE